MLKTELLTSAQILPLNPILQDREDAKKQYALYLYKCLRSMKLLRRKNVKAQMIYYAKVLAGHSDFRGVFSSDNLELIKPYWYTIPFDFGALAGLSEKTLSLPSFQDLINHCVRELSLDPGDEEVFRDSFAALLNDSGSWERIEASRQYKKATEYYRAAKKNASFMKEKPFGIFVTATMSAGKSTFTNALVGRNVSRMQNLACTQKIHTIIGKAYDDGIVSEYDGELVIDAGREELLNDSESNTQTKLMVSTFLQGMLGGERIVIYDSPGVNFSGNTDHSDITEHLLESKKYNLMVYLLNATQLSTEDQARHLELVSKRIGRVPIIFALNRVDDLLVNGEDAIGVIQRQEAFLKQFGFKNPMLCPVSARAGYLAKKHNKEGLSPFEKADYQLFLSLFRNASLERYYKETFPLFFADSEHDQEVMLERQCGLTFIESLIHHYIKGEGKNDRRIREV